MRIVTRPDFDGVVCAVLLYDILDISEPIFWIEPYEMRHGNEDIRKGDIITNLPYVENCSLWFDHHYSNQIEKSFEGAFKIAPSAAGIIYEYYNNSFSKDFAELVKETDKIDSADFSIDEVLNPEKYPYIMLYFTLSGRNKADENYWNKIVHLLSEYEILKVNTDPDVKKKINVIIEQDREYKNYLKNYTTKKKHLSITDFRSLSAEPKGNRFLVYSIFSDSLVNMKIRYDKNNKEKVIISLGQNIFNRTSKVHLGHLVSQYGGGGHSGAGSCHFHISEAEEKIDEIINILLTDEAIH
jgi:oligoribonuclease NrnB/cAMP/cGMP phosphodiesterase (DHH superfamily)